MRGLRLIRVSLRVGGNGPKPGPASEVALGGDIRAGQRPQIVIPGGVWQAAAPAGDDAVLVSCVVTPGFDFADFALLP